MNDIKNKDQEIRRLKKRIKELERMQATGAMSEQEKLIHTIAENFPNTFISVIEKDLTVGFSAGHEFKKQGLDPDSFVGLKLEDVFGDQTKTVKQHYLETFNGKETSFEIKFNNRDLSFKTIPLVDHEGKIPRILAVVENITERKKEEEALLEEKAFTDMALDGQLDTFFLFDPVKGKALRWNQSFSDISGYSDQEIEKMPAPASYYSPADLKRAGAFLQTVIKKGTGTIELELICKDGRKILTEYRVSVIKNDQGEPKYMISIGRDITERKQVDEELRKLASVVRYSSELVNLATLDGKMIFLNDAGAKMLGIDIEAVENVNIMQVIPDHLQELVQKELLPALMNNRIWKGELQYRNLKTGKLTDVYAVTFTITDPVTGAPLYLANVSLNITERKQVEKELIKYRDHLEELVEERTQELEKTNIELKEKNVDLERYFDATVDRELRMKELHDHIEKLEKKLEEKK